MGRGRGSAARWWRRAGRVVSVGVLAGLAVDTARLRRRAGGLRTLVDGSPLPGDGHQLLEATGVQVDQATLDAARAHAHTHGLAALDLIPYDLPAAAALDLLRAVDPARYRGDRLAAGRGACHAVLADKTLLHTAGVASNGSPTAAELAAAVVQLKLHAPAGPQAAAAAHGAGAGLALVPRLAWGAALAAGGLSGPCWAAAALAAWSAQPLAVFAGSGALRPADLWSYSAARAVKEPARLAAALRAARSAQRSERAEKDPVEVRRPAYHADLAGGVERLFEPKRACCPWCAGTDLRARLATTDLVQRKPGRFTLDRCHDCGHVFQNPRLSADGLEFYYRDFYDGLGEQLMSVLFSGGGGRYRSSAQALRPVDAPRSWLDVGTGHGHFCNAAREVWPQTAFDGLDMGAGVELAARRGWVDRAWQGRLVDLASGLAGSYDVVSMFHYLEHTTDPHAELTAARTVLRPGGHLLIEVPDPQSRWAGLLGRWWLPWFQPQHLHLMPAANLRAKLAELGFTVTLEQHAEPHIPVDLLGAAWLALNAAAPADDLPWLPRPSRLQRRCRAGTITAAVPVLLAAALADQLIAPLGRKAGLSNAYRILARKN